MSQIWSFTEHRWLNSRFKSTFCWKWKMTVIEQITIMLICLQLTISFDDIFKLSLSPSINQITSKLINFALSSSFHFQILHDVKELLAWCWFRFRSKYFVTWRTQIVYYFTQFLRFGNRTILKGHSCKPHCKNSWYVSW